MSRQLLRSIPILFIVIQVISLATSTFASQTSRELQTMPTISLCELARQHQLYDKRIVRVRASDIAWWESNFLYDLSCNSGDTYIWPEFQPEVKNLCTASQESLNNNMRPDNNNLAHRVELILVGRFYDYDGVGYGHLNGFRFKMLVLCVERAKPIPETVAWPHEHRLPTPITKGKEEIEALTNQWMSLFLGYKPELYANILAAEYALTTPDGRVLSKDEAVLEFRKPKSIKEASMPVESVWVYSDSSVVRGQVILMNNDRNRLAAKYRFTNVYIKLQDKWLIVSTHMSPLK